MTALNVVLWAVVVGVSIMLITQLFIWFVKWVARLVKQEWRDQ